MPCARRLPDRICACRWQTCRKGIQTEAAISANVNATQTLGTNVSKTVIGTQFNITATTVNTLFGSNKQLRTTLTVTGLDSGARLTVPVTITQQSLT